MSIALARSDLTGMLRQALPQWGLPGDTALTLLNVSENVTFRADPPGGSPVILRVHRPNYHRADEIRSEIAWIDALRRENVVETPVPLAGRDGEWVQRLVAPRVDAERHVVAFAFASGAEPAPDADLPGWFGRLGP